MIVWDYRLVFGACLAQIWGNSEHLSRPVLAFPVASGLSDQVGPSFEAFPGFEPNLPELDRLCAQATFWEIPAFGLWNKKEVFKHDQIKMAN